MLNRLILAVKRGEGPSYRLLRRMAVVCTSASLPSVKAVHLPLYYLDWSGKLLWKRMLGALWWVPLFRARCEEAGTGIRLPNGIPWIVGSHLKLFVGDHVTIGRTTIGASKVYDEAVLRIGSNTSIGYGTTISVAREVEIGSNCMISFNCLIMDNDDHPISPERRLRRACVKPEDVKPVRIGDNVWIGAHCAVLKGVEIGKNSIVACHSVVTENVKEDSLYVGNPARCVKENLSNF